VPEHSACLERYIPQTIHADHINMTKFKRNDDNGYRKVAVQLKRWAREVKCDDARQVPSQRTSNPGAQVPLSTQRPVMNDDGSGKEALAEADSERLASSPFPSRIA
jgi:hypothetical protein